MNPTCIAVCLCYVCVTLRHPRKMKVKEGGCLWSNKSYLLTACLTTILRKSQMQWAWVNAGKVGTKWCNIYICVCLWQWDLKTGEISINERHRASQHSAGADQALCGFYCFPPIVTSVLLHKQKAWNESRAVLARTENVKEISSLPEQWRVLN